MADDDAATAELGDNARRRVLKRMRQFTQRTRGESGEKINVLMKRFSAARQLAEQQAQLLRVGQNNNAEGDPKGPEADSEETTTSALVVSNSDGGRDLGQSLQGWGKSVDNKNQVFVLQVYHELTIVSFTNSSQRQHVDLFT